MKAIVLEAPFRLALKDVAEPDRPGPGEALARVRRVGVCGTDLHAYGGAQNFFSYPRVMGHELAVEALEIGETEGQPPYAVGDSCCVIPYLHCGKCAACLRGKSNCCANMQVLGVHIDGGMRERFTLPVDKLLKADGLSVEELALVEMLSIGAHAARRAQVSPGEQALVIGAGPIGLATAQFAKIIGADVMMMEVNEKRLAFCADALGIDKLIHGRDDPLGQITRMLGGELPSLVLDCTGSAGSMQAAFDFVAHGGTLVFVGHTKGDLTFSNPLFHAREMTLLASRNALLEDFRWVIDCLLEGRVNLDAWISHRASPESIVADFPAWLNAETGLIKAMLSFE